MQHRVPAPSTKSSTVDQNWAGLPEDLAYLAAAGYQKWAGASLSKKDAPFASGSGSWPATAELASERVLAYFAPVMRTHRRSTGFSLASSSGPSGVSRDRLAQNALLVTDRGLYLLCIIPPSLWSTTSESLSADAYTHTKMNLFTAGTEVADQLSRLLASLDLPTTLSADPRNLRFDVATSHAFFASGSAVSADQHAPDSLMIDVSAHPFTQMTFRSTHAAQAFAAQWDQQLHATPGSPTPPRAHPLLTSQAAPSHSHFRDHPSGQQHLPR